MKRISKTKIVLIGIILIISVIPFPIVYKDGGTTHYNAILYQYISWHRIISNEYNEETGKYEPEYYEAKEFRFFPFNWINYFNEDSYNLPELN